MSLHMGLGTHVSSAVIGAVKATYHRVDHADCFSYVNLVGLRLHAVREDHFQRVAPDWPSEGVIVINGSREHAWDHTPVCSSKLLRGQLAPHLCIYALRPM